MKIWDAYEYTHEITQDADGNKAVEVSLMLTSNADVWDVLTKLSEMLEEGLIANA